MLEFRPESDQELAGRFDLAIREVVIPDLIASGRRQRPGMQRENVFDFQDGVRLVVSRDRLPCGVRLHVSCSLVEGSRVAYGLAGKSRVEAVSCFVNDCVRRAERMASPANLRLDDQFITQGGIVHLVFGDVEPGEVPHEA